VPKVPDSVRAAGAKAVDALPPAVGGRVRRALGRPGLRAVALPAFDREFQDIGALFESDPDEARSRLERTVVTVPGAPPPDPFSDAYRAWTWELYRRISGREGYDVANESSPFDLEAATARPFPYATGSARTVGRDLIARGHVLRTIGDLGVGAGARVVEFGPGWGNLTADLTASGIDVTAVEVDHNFCALLRRRHTGPGRLKIAPLDMLTFTTDVAYDVAIFFESFHHCADHLTMLRRVHDVVRPEGFVVFASEPVHDMPYPWGPRLDGLSVWSSRTYGWLELGFQKGYFAQALDRTGWQGTRERLGAGDGELDVIVAVPSG
jgi:SAM-dependent methyltransferase